MAIRHTITAQANGKSLTIDELRAFTDEALRAGAHSTDTVTSSGFGGGFRQVVVSIVTDEPEPVHPTPEPRPTPAS